MKKSNLITISILLLILVGAGFVAYKVSHTGENAENSEAAKSLASVDAEKTTYTDLSGNPVDLGQYAGKVRVVNSWATWCPFCVQELKDFSKLATEMGDKVVVLAINRKEPIEKVKAYKHKLGDAEGIVFIQDEKDYFYESIGAFSMPETIFYDETGNIVFHKRGFMDLDEMRKHTEAALNNTK